MATANAIKQGWSDYAVLQASSGGREWTVQFHAGTQAFRCSCPSFIFSKDAPKACKHTRFCRSQWQSEGAPASVAARVSEAPAAPAVPVLQASAKTMFAAMCAAARSQTGLDAMAQLGPKAMPIMVEALRSQLLMFNPAAAEAASAMVSAAVTRRITFDD